jgi:hypothetical protein
VPTVNGIDGLVWANGALVGVQNGVWPHRVVRLDLDPSRARIAAVTVLARAHPDFDEPTLGVMVGPDFHFVANSQWEAVGEQGQVDEARLRPAVVLRVPVR